MKRIGVLTDTTAHLSLKLLNENQIDVVSLSVSYDGAESIIETPDMDCKELFSIIKKNKSLPSSSQPSVGAYLEAFENISKNYKEIVVISLSSGISGTYQGAKSAANLFMEENPGIKITVIDSMSAGRTQGYMVVKAAQMANQGCSVDEIELKIKDLISSFKINFVVDNMENLMYGGRVSKTSATLGNMLGIKPILTFNKFGEIVLKDKARSMKKVYLKVISYIEEDLNDMSADSTMYVIFDHALADDKVSEFLEILKEKNYNNLEVVDAAKLGPVIGTHVGSGAIGISWIIDKK